MSHPPPDDLEISLIAGDPDIIVNLIQKQDLRAAELVRNPAIEASLVKHAKRGEQTAFEVLYWRYNKPIWNRLVRMVTSRQIAEELHQETFLRAWINLLKVDDNGFGPWLYRIAANVAIDYLRRRSKLTFLSFSDYEPEEDEYLSKVGPEELICELDLLEQALAQIAPRFRTCIVLQDVWGYSQREIAALLKIPVNYVGSYICRGREQLRQLLQGLDDLEGRAQ